MARRKHPLPAIGERFGRWTVTAESRLQDKHRLVPCICACGTKAEVQNSDLWRTDGRASHSCGCIKREAPNSKTRTHGESRSRLYQIWTGMVKRCYNAHTRCYYRYGGRGIQMCSEWRIDYVAFRDWSLANGYTDGLTIDRRDNDGNYEPSNCRWLTKKGNTRNNSQVVRVTAFGETKAMGDWSEDHRCVVEYSTLKVRIRKGWHPERAITEMPGKGRGPKKRREKIVDTPMN